MAREQQIEIQDSSHDAMPAPVRRVVLGVVGVLTALALVLVALRGEALLLDLQAIGTRVFCW
jgi:hypothetical protein